MDSYAIIDRSDFPIIRIRFTGSKSTDDNFQAYLDDTQACYLSKKRLAIIFDASNASVPARSHQKMQANWLKENEQLMTDFCAGTAYIIPNAAIRVILKLIFSFQKQPVPYRIFESIAEADTWVNELDLS
jgi:hypothetical protein